MAMTRSKDEPDSRFLSSTDSEEEYEGILAGNWVKVQKKKGNAVSRKYRCAGGPETKCGVEITDGENGVTCAICETRYHAECQNLKTAAYKALIRYEGFLAWICQSCKDGLKRSKLFSSSQNMLNELKEEIKNQTRIIKKTSEENNNMIHQLGELHGKSSAKLREEVAKIKSTLVETNTVIKEHKIEACLEKNATYAEVVSRMGKNMSEICSKMEKESTEVDKRLASMEQNVVRHIVEQSETIQTSSKSIGKVAESKEREDRAANLIIHNIDESQAGDLGEKIQHDKNVFKSMARGIGYELDDSEIDRIIRLNRKDITEGNHKTRLILVKLRSAEVAQKIFDKRMGLKDAGFPNKYITRDKSPAERLLQRQLRTQLHEKGKATHRIFRNRVVPRDQ